MALAGCSRHGEQSGTVPMLIDKGGQLTVPEGSPLRERLLVQTAASQAAPYTLQAPATVQADPAHTLTILPPLTGRVVELKVGLGEQVKRGQPLVVIASGDLAQAYADVDKAQDSLAVAKKALDRIQAAGEAGAAATKDVEAAQSAYNQALAESERAEVRLRSLGGAPDHRGADRQLVVTAPVDGSITALSVAAGMFVNDATAPMMTLSNLDTVWVTAAVAENQVAGIAPGEKVDVSLAAYPGETLHGSIASVDRVLAADTRREELRVTFPNPQGRLKPNMYGTASIYLPQPAAVVVPQSAILMNNDSTTVFVEVSPWTFVRREVEIGYDEGNAVRILSGLKAGERVVVRGGVLLND